MDPRLLETLKKNASWLTPTRRLALQLRQEANAYFAQSHKVWPTPQVFSLEDWLIMQWEQWEIRGFCDRLLLTPMQSLLQWEHIVKHSVSGRPLYYIEQSAKIAWQAWCLLHEWKALSLLARTPLQGDEAAFQEWVKTYRVWLESDRFLDKAMLLEEIINLLCRHASAQALVFYGFEELTPSLLEATDRLEKKGWEVISLSPLPLLPAKIDRYAFQDRKAECKAAALWVKALLDQGKTGIAVVVPQLVQYRTQIELIFRDLLDPLAVCSPIAEVNRHFNISAAIPLTHYPIIQNALDCLKIGLSSFSLPEYKSILLSPFIKKQEERERLADLSMLAKAPLLNWSLAEIINFTSAPFWKQILSEVQNTLHDTTPLMRLSEWGKHFQVLLTCMGWPGERTLTSIEYQAVKRWIALLEELRLYDAILPPLNFKSALSHLRKCAANVPFQPENKEAPVQILGVLEAAGQHFQYLWIMGLHSEAWPGLVEPNPFIPFNEQRERKMPHASPEKEMRYASKMTTRFKESAKEVIFSSPLSENGKVLDPSALIKDIILSNSEEKAGENEERCEHFFEGVLLEKIEDRQAPPVSPEEAIKGSSTLLKRQSACPFKAFSEIRLGAVSTPLPSLWLTPALEGIILHEILEKWEPLKTLSLEDLIDLTLKKEFVREAPLLYREVEKSRFKMIIEDYYQLEKTRPPFEIVAIEYKKTFDFAGLSFHIRIDRLDRDEKDNLFIIDYKAGYFTVKDWEGESPKEPQLLLYALALEAEDPKALRVIRLNSKKCEYEGIFEEIADLLPQWRQHLTALTEAFLRGDAAVDPLPDACQYCQLDSFCRVKEDE